MSGEFNMPGMQPGGGLITITEPSAPTGSYLTTEWESHGTVTIDATGTNPTKGTSGVLDKLYSKDVGDYTIVKILFYQLSAGTAGSGDYLISVPANKPIDTSGLSNHGHIANTGSYLSATWPEIYTGASLQTIGPSYWSDSPTKPVVVTPVVYSSTHVRLQSRVDSSNVGRFIGSSIIGLDATRVAFSTEFVYKRG